jgi:hypothetical protein
MFVRFWHPSSRHHDIAVRTMDAASRGQHEFSVRFASGRRLDFQDVGPFWSYVGLGCVTV